MHDDCCDGRSSVTPTTFNPLTAARDLEDAGFERRQAEAIATVVAHGDERAATKADLDAAIGAVRSELAIMRWDVGIQSAVTLATFAIVAAKLL